VASVPRPDSSLKRRLSKLASTRVANPVVRRLLERGLMPRTHALLETTGRRTGRPRRVPVGNGLRGETFWIVTEHGRATDYVKNIEADPRVRVKVGREWREGRAYLLPDDDVHARMKELHRPANDALVRMAGSDLMTVRIDLDPNERDSARA
jgi:deazaflavin-dependent oxidoreductase (nitroreductase family)